MSELEDKKIDREIDVQNAEAAYISSKENLAVVENQAKSDVDLAILTLDFAKQDLEKYIKGDYLNELHKREATITLNKEKFERAKDTLMWSEKLADENFISNTELQGDKLAKDEAEMNVQIAEQDKNIAALKKQLQEEIAKSRLAAKSAWRDISEVSFAEGDRYLLANLIYCEAGNQPYAGQVAVGAVVINRVLSSVYPNTVSGVIYQYKQFAPVLDGHLAIALANDSATAACYKAADEAMSGYTNVGRCVYFRTPIEGLTGMQIGGHIFY